MAELFLLSDKLEAALVVLVTPAAPLARVLPGKTAEDLGAAPVIVCSAQTEDQADPPGTGNFFVNCAVAIKTSAVVDETGTQDPARTVEAVKAANETLVKAVAGVVFVEGLAELLSEAVEGLTVFPGSVTFGAPESGRDAAGVWNDVLHFRCYACGVELG